MNDSKKLTEKKRLALFPEIKEKALAWSVGRCSPAEIDELNILNATMLAMTRAVEGLSVQPDYVLIDGNRVPELPMQGQAVVKGDLRVAEISAASIIAKVVRDHEMEELDKLHPEFGFAKHKGYPTKAHFEAIEKHGVIEQHRKSFKPVKRALGLID
ncbi:ribonuclease HII [Vibrio ishigakensis]|uniref:Ribonuclease n=1 Tax=Vibrio ishigakensis TaxID=1481914 RepID=A0A0B8NYG4_9VIBR|nr:ribonuclease HII [Vibrio ishigakensis]